jgi:hypothetical protein
MAGILNNKERIIDFVITDAGKKQAAIGELRINFASFTDLHTFYETSGSSEIPTLAADASDRIFFEAFNRYQDTIVPELEAGYSLQPFQTKDFTVVGSSIISGTFTPNDISGSHGSNILTGSILGASLPMMLDGITENFGDQRIIGSVDEFSFYQDFQISPMTASFFIDNNTNYGRAGVGLQGNVMLDDVPSIFSDQRFADFANFKFLPPENVPNVGAESGSLLGNYPRLNEQEIISLDDMMNKLKSKQVQVFEFDKTSRTNNIVIQFFERGTGGITKLAVIDFGEFDDDDVESAGRRVLFVGKIKRDSFGADTFVSVFTVVID